MAILRNDTVVKSADGQHSSAIITAANIGSHSIAPNSTYYIGTTQNVFNRASGAQTLTGVSIDGNAANITAYTINQNVGTGNTPSFAGLVSSAVTNYAFLQVTDTNNFWITPGNNNWGLYFETSAGGLLGGTGDSNRLGFVGAGSARFYVDLNNGNGWFGGSLTANTDSRAPIFYDSANTSFYCDPASTSKFNEIWTTDNGNNTTAPRWDTSFYVMQSQHWYSHTGASTMYAGESGDFVYIRGYSTADGSFRSPIFYDSNNTAYYLDAANSGTSLLVAGNVGIGTTSPIGKLQVESATFNGGNGVYANSRIGVMLNGSLTSYVYASTYNDPTFPDYGFVFIHGTNTSNYNVWSISPDGPAKGSGLHFIYGANATNIHSTTPRISFIGSTGNVGIGTTSPSQKLHVVGTGFASTDFRAPIFYDSDNTTYYGDFASTSKQYQAILFGDSSRYSAVSATINGTGAGDKLILYGNASNYDARVLVGDDYDFIFKSQGSPSSKGMFRFYSGNSATLALEISATQNTTSTGDFRAPIFYDSNNTAYYLDPANSGTSLLVAGKVGIGTTSPGALLEVSGTSGDGVPTFKVTSTAAAGTFNWAGTILNSSLGSSRNFILFIGKTASTKNAAYIGYNHSGTDGSNTNFLTLGHYASDNLLNILGNGNVGIGTTSPGYKLDITGDARIASAAGAGALYFGTTDPSNIYLKLDNSYDLTLAQNAASGNGLYLAGAGNVYLSIDSNNNETDRAFIVQKDAVKAGAELFRVQENGVVTASSDFRAPIFYDSNNTSYYCDPSSTSNLVGLTVANTITGSVSGNAATASNATQFGGEANTNFMRGLAGGTEANINNYTDNGFRSVAYTGHGKALLSFSVGSSIGTVQQEYFYNIPANGWRVRNKTDSTTWSSWGNVVMTDTNQGALTGTVITTGNSSGLSPTFTNLNAAVFYDSNNTAYYINPAGNSIISSLTFDSNITIYKHNDRNLLIQGGGGTDAGLLGRGSSGQFAFQVYGSGSGSYGFLDGAWAGWDIRKVVDGDLFLNDNNTYYLNPGSTTNLNNLTVAGTMTFGTLAYTTGSRRSKNSSNVNVETVTGLVSPTGPTFLEIRGFCPTTMYRTTGDRPAPYGLGFGNGAESGGIMPIGAGDNLQEIMLYGANSGPTTFTFKRQIWEGTAQDPDGSNYYGSAVFSINTGTGAVTASTDIRAPIFYDSNNTAYYIDGASGSKLKYLQIDGDWGSSPFGSGHESFTIRSTYASMVQRQTNGSLGYWLHHIASDGVYHLYGGRGATDGSSWDWAYRAYPNQDGNYVEFNTSARAQIFYDRNNTAYYLDPANTGTSLLVAGKVGIGTTSPTYKLQIGTVGSLDDSIRIGTYQVAKNTRQYIGNTRDDSGLFESAGNGDTPSTVLGGVAGIRIVNTEGTLYAPQADNSVQLLTHIYNGGSRVALHANYNGNVGIGTTSPSQTLHVVGTGFASSDFRSPIFYDSNDTGYYLDPRSASVLSGLKLNGIGNDAAGNTSDAILWINKPDNNDWGIRVTGNLEYLLKLEGATSHTYNIQGLANGSEFWRCGTDLLYHNSNIRAPIFYDTNNTAYYVDPNSTSNLVGLTVANTITGSVSGSSGSCTGNSATATRTSSQSGYPHAGTGMFAFYNWGGTDGGTSAPSASTYTTGISVGSNPGDQAYGFQIANNMWNTGLWTRNYNSSFGAWIRLLDSSNYVGYSAFTSSLTSTVDARAPIFYDSNNTAYYVDPANTGYSAYFAGAIQATKIGIEDAGLDCYMEITDANPVIYGVTYGGEFIFYGDKSTPASFLYYGGATVTYTLQANSSLRAPIFYDSNDTTYYGDFASTSWLRQLSVGDVNAANDGGWNARLNLTGSQHARLDVKSNSDGIITTIYSHTGNAAGKVGTMSNHPLVFMVNGNAAGYAYANYLQGADSVRAPIFYDSDNTGYYLNPAGNSQVVSIYANDWFRAQGNTGLYFQDKGYGITSAGAASNSYGNASTYGTGLNGWQGWGIGSRHCMMSTGGDNFGIHDNTRSWLYYWDGTYHNFQYGYLQSASSVRGPLFYDSNDTGYYLDPASTSNLNSLVIAGTLTSAAYNNLANDYKDIYVYGDVNTYYIVLIQGEYIYSFGRYSVTRGYNWTGPDTWYVASHKGGLTLDWEWSGDTAWGGNDKAIRIIEFNESYSNMVAGLGYPVNGGVIIWLRGGGVNGAQYRIRTPNGSNSVVTVYDGVSAANHSTSTTFTAADSTVFSTRANTNNVSAEIFSRYPVRATGSLFNDGNAVLDQGSTSQTKSGILSSSASLRAPIFYDTDDTTYLGDFASRRATNINGFTARTKMTLGLTAKYQEDRADHTGDTNYWVGAMGWINVDMNTLFDYGCGFIDTWNNPGNQPSGTSHWTGIQSMHYTNGTARYGWQMVGGPIQNLRFRNTWSTFTSWKTIPVLDVNDGNSGAMYAGIYYDSANTTYFIDPASTSNLVGLTVANTITGSITGNAGGSSASCSGNAATATILQTARTIGGVSFNGSANINLPGVNTAGNQNTTGTAANVTGTVAIANGGTGATTAAAARSNLGIPAAETSSNQSLSGSTTCTIDVAAANVHILALASGTTISSFTYNNRSASPLVNTILVVLKFAGTATVTWSNVVWSNGTTPTLTGVNGKADVYSLTSYKGGTTGPAWIGSVVGQNMDSTNL